MSLLAAGIAQGAGALIGGGLRLVGSAKQLKAQKRIGRQLSGANKAYMEQLQGLSDRLDDRPQLEIDDSAVTEQVNRARRSQITAGGRSIGEEAMRDSVRQSTADAIAQGRGAGGSTADLLSFASAARVDEQRAMSGIDAESASRRERSLFAAEERLNSALSKQQSFNQWRDQALYQDELNAFNQKLQMDQGIAGTGYDLRMGELSQQGAIADSKAAMWGAVGGIAEGIGSGASNLFMAQGEIDALGGEGGSSGGSLMSRADRKTERARAFRNEQLRQKMRK